MFWQPCVRLCKVKNIEFTMPSHTKELKRIPLEYLIDRVKPVELLEIWCNLRREYQNNFELQIRLPCFIHYNRSDSTTHFDGPVPSQKLCYLCNKNIYTHV